jgi:hypothetical protein
MITFQIVFIPILTIVSILISFIASSIVLRARNTLGFVGDSSPNKIIFVSTSTGSQINVPESWSNRIIYVSLDVEGTLVNANLSLFDAINCPPGTTLTIEHSLSSPAQGSVNIVAENLSISLGRGQGITLISQRQIPFTGVTYDEGAYGFSADIPEIQNLLWKPFQVYNADSNLMCSAFNLFSGVDSNIGTGGCPTGFTLAPSADPDLNAPVCQSAKCVCDPESLSKSVWCNS